MEPVDAYDTRAKILQTTLSEIAQNSSASASNEESCCVICLDRISDQAIATPCQHSTFDFLCLTSWLEQQQKCPLCKTPITAVKYSFDLINGAHETYQVPLPKAKAPAQAQRPVERSYFQRHTYRPRRHTPAPTEDEALQRRRHIYRHQLYSLHVGSNRLSRFRDLTPTLFANSPELQSRARKWIRRELRVFEFLSPDSTNENANRRANNAEFLLEYILAILKTVDVQGAGGQAEEMLQEFLGRENTRLFLHELRQWLRSPYMELGDWDRNVQYNEGGLGVKEMEGERDGQRGSQLFGQKERVWRGGGGRGRGQSSSGYDRYTPYGSRRRRGEEMARRRYIPD